MARPLVLFDPATIGVDELFDAQTQTRLIRRFQLVETRFDVGPGIYDAQMREARFMIGRPPLRRVDLMRCHRLRAVIDLSSDARSDIAYHDCSRLGVSLLSAGPGLARSTAELALGMTLSLLRDIHGSHEAMRSGTERFGAAGASGHRSLAGSEIGFLGFGAIGEAIHRLLRPMCDRMQVHDPARSLSELADLGVQGGSVEQVCSRADILYVSASQTPASERLLGKQQIDAMKPGSTVLVIGHATTVDMQALSAACGDGRLQAGLDVFDAQPPAPDDPIRSTPNVLLSPHRGGALPAVRHELGRRIVEDLERMSDGLAPRNCKVLEPPLELSQAAHSTSPA